MQQRFFLSEKSSKEYLLFFCYATLHLDSIVKKKNMTNRFKNHITSRKFKFWRTHLGDIIARQRATLIFKWDKLKKYYCFNNNVPFFPSFSRVLVSNDTNILEYTDHGNIFTRKCHRQNCLVFSSFFPSSFQRNTSLLFSLILFLMLRAGRSLRLNMSIKRLSLTSCC